MPSLMGWDLASMTSLWWLEVWFQDGETENRECVGLLERWGIPALIPIICRCILEPHFSKWDQWNQQPQHHLGAHQQQRPSAPPETPEWESACQQDPGVGSLCAQYSLGNITLGICKEPQTILLLSQLPLTHHGARGTGLAVCSIISCPWRQ